MHERKGEDWQYFAGQTLDMNRVVSAWPCWVQPLVDVQIVLKNPEEHLSFRTSLIEWQMFSFKLSAQAKKDLDFLERVQEIIR